MSIRLYIKDRQEAIGTVSSEQFDSLAGLLEEEAAGDRDYYIDRDILEYLEEEGADKEVLTLLRPFVGDTEGIEIEWREEP